MGEAPNKLGEALAKAGAARAAGDLAQAEALYRAIAAAHPQEPEPLHHLGGVLKMRGDRAGAEAIYKRVLELAPGADATARVLALMLLEDGRFPEGFAYLEARHAMPTMAKPALPCPEWLGGPVAGKALLIWPEQGFGDQIQFARFAPILQRMGADVTLLCRPGLVRLFAGALGVRVLGAAGAVEFPDPDLFVMQGSLAARLGVTVDTVPAAPYLRAVSGWPDLGPGFKVGLKTQGNPGHHNDANRSLPREAAERLRALPARIVSLEPEDTGAQDFADTAAIVDQLDLVITVDTAVAHLAGAMGKPCWVLIPAIETDWRWLRERTDSPWYPSVRLYRHTVPGDWAGPLDRIAADLAALSP